MKPEINLSRMYSGTFSLGKLIYDLNYCKKVVKVVNKLTTGRQCGQALAFDIHPGPLEPLCPLTILDMEFLL